MHVCVFQFIFPFFCCLDFNLTLTQTLSSALSFVCSFVPVSRLPPFFVIPRIESIFTRKESVAQDKLCHTKLGMKLRKEKRRYPCLQRPMNKISRSSPLPNCRHLLSFRNQKLFFWFRLQRYSVFLSHSHHTFGIDPTTLNIV